MYKAAKAIVDHAWFGPAVMGVILLASLLVGLETYPAIRQSNEHLFLVLDRIIQAVFTIEIVVRILSYDGKPLEFFRSAWNVFDFAVTALIYFPFAGSFAPVLRLIRILRVLRLVTALPRLQLLVGALIKSIPSIGYVAVLLFVQFYIFAVIGNAQFGKTDPSHFGDLGKAMITLFEIVTLEGWVEIYQSQPNVVAATIYFITFIVLGTMIVLNLFIGVVLNGFEEVKRELEDNHNGKKRTLASELSRMEQNVDQMKRTLETLKTRYKNS